MRAGPSSEDECMGVEGVTGVIGDIKGESSEVVDEDASETSVPLDEAEASDVSDRLELLVDDRDVNFRRGAGGGGESQYLYGVRVPGPARRQTGSCIRVDLSDKVRSAFLAAQPLAPERASTVGQIVTLETSCASAEGQQTSERSQNVRTTDLCEGKRRRRAPPSTGPAGRSSEPCEQSIYGRHCERQKGSAVYLCADAVERERKGRTFRERAAASRCLRVLGVSASLSKA